MKKFYTCFLAVCAFSFVCALCAQPRRAAQIVRPTILRTIPHDTSAFTQGLILVDSLLYESTGIVGHSTLRRVDAATGRVLLKIPVPDVFAEGITIHNGELVQLTWKDEFAIRYDFPSLRPKGMFKYRGEGWGLTNDGTHFIMSNGSDTLYFRNNKLTSPTAKNVIQQLEIGDFRYNS